MTQGSDVPRPWTDGNERAGKNVAFVSKACGACQTVVSILDLNSSELTFR